MLTYRYIIILHVLCQIFDITNTLVITVFWHHFNTVLVCGSLPVYTNSIRSLVVEFKIHTIMNFICS
jgi:hypothetical protein